MPTLGDEKYPDLDPDDAVEIADVLVNEFGGEVSSEEAFAQSIGHKTANSGAYINKVADLRRYGILPSRGINATDLAFRLANPESEFDEKEAKFAMLENVPLLSSLYDQLNASEPPQELWRVLTEITDANPKEAKEVEPWIQQLYERMLSLEIDESGKVSNQTPSGTPTESTPSTSSTEESVGIYVRVGTDELRLGKVTETNLTLAEAFLNSKSEMLEHADQEKSDEGSTLALGDFTDQE